MMTPMFRKTLTTIVLALVAAFTIASIADAAPRRVIHHRTRHSSRLSSSHSSSKTKRGKTHHSTRRAKKSARKSVRSHKPTTRPR